MQIEITGEQYATLLRLVDRLDDCPESYVKSYQNRSLLDMGRHIQDAIIQYDGVINDCARLLREIKAAADKPEYGE